MSALFSSTLRLWKRQGTLRRRFENLACAPSGLRGCEMLFSELVSAWRSSKCIELV